MKKCLLLCLVGIMLLANNLCSQIIYEDDFESYTENQGIAAQSEKWVTWSGNTSEDPKVSTVKAKSGTKSINVKLNNDAIVKLNNFTEGRYCVSFNMLVKPGKMGYFNLLQKFDPTGDLSIWGVDVYLRDGKIYVVANGERVLIEGLSYTPDEWVNIKTYVDLDTDIVSIYINDTFANLHKWTSGSHNKGSEILALNAINFFGAKDQYPGFSSLESDYFIDDLKIEKLTALEAVNNFNYVIEELNNVKLSWEAPANGTPVSYLVLKDASLITKLPASTTTYTAVDQYPKTYKFAIIVDYGDLGTSPAIYKELTIEGGVERECVIFEALTSVTCGYCPYAAKAFDKLAADGSLKVGLIEYHYDFNSPPDPYHNPVFAPLYNYYEATGFPTVIINGSFKTGTSTDVKETTDAYKEMYKQIKAKPAVLSINTSPLKIADNKYKIDVEIKESFKLYNDEIKLFIVLTETDIPHSWLGMSHVNFVAREVYPNNKGEILNFSGQTTENKSYEIQIPNTYKTENCEFVIFVQHTASKEILQANKIKVSNIPTAISTETNDSKLSIYPNPAVDVLNIESNSLIDKIEILSIDGKIINSISTKDTKVKCNTKDLVKGFYILKIYQDNKISSKHFVVQ